MFFICREYFVGNDSKKQHTASANSNADLITNHLNETTAAAAKATNGTSQ
jgi:hypothetical protein